MPIASPVAVVGAGFLGTRVVRALHGRGVPVFATARAPGTRELGVDVEVRALDIVRDPLEHVREQLDGARSIVLCYSSGGLQDRRAVFLDGGRRVLEACAALHPERLIYTSSTSALPDLDGLLDEDCEEWPEHERGRIQREAEEMVTRACTAAAISCAILRLAGLYGPGRELGRIYRSDPAHVLEGDGLEPTNLIHVDDACAAILAALARPDLLGLFQVCADEHTSRRDMYARAAALAGLPAPRWALDPAPGAPLRGKRVDNTRMKRILGLDLAHPDHVLQVFGRKGSPSG